MTTRARSIPTRSLRRRSAGLTLIESIIAVVVVSLAAPPLLIAMSDSSASRVSQSLRTRARWLAVERLETIIADRHSASRGYNHLVTSNYPTESSIPGFPGYTRTVTFATTGATFAAGSGYRTCTVSVAWKDPRAGASTLTLSAVVTDYTP